MTHPEILKFIRMQPNSHFTRHYAKERKNKYNTPFILEREYAAEVARRRAAGTLRMSAGVARAKVVPTYRNVMGIRY